MSGWRTLHATVKNKNELPDKEDITEYISERGAHSRTNIYGDTLYVLAMDRDASHLKQFAEKYAEAFSTVGIGRGNDTGSGNDSVTFYSTDNGQLQKEMSHDCPIVHDGLRVESTR